MHKTKKVRTLVSVTVVVALCLLLAAALATPRSASPYHRLRIFARVLSHLERLYVEPIDDDELIFGAIRGMMRTLDPHSSFLLPQDYEMLEADSKGRFGGVGLEVGIRDDLLTVITPISGSPAEQAGVKPGDQIVAIEGKPTRTMNIEDAVRLMRGEPGTTVTATFRREGESKSFDVVFKRAIIRVESVHAELLEPGFPLIGVRLFQDGTTAEVKEELDRLISEGGGLEGVVLDLRRNPGGVFREAVLLADLFIERGVLVTTRGRGDEILEEHKASALGTFDEVPVVALIDGASASAAEIVAGALQDHGRAMLVGTRSFGKGSVQSIIDLGGGFGLKLTVARYFTPNGRSIQVEGVQPDVVIESRIAPAPDAETDAVAAATAEGDLPGHLEPTAPSPVDAKVVEIEDYQLRVAYQLLGGLARARQSKGD